MLIRYLYPPDLVWRVSPDLLFCILIFRKRLQLSSAQSLFLLVNQRTMTCASTLIGDVYKDDKDDDGFLYIVYASQEMFG